MHTAAERFPLIPAGTGEIYDLYGELLTFKVRSAETGGACSVLELAAQPGGGPPLHTHPSAETFHVLEGTFEFIGLDAGGPYTLRAALGDTVFIPGSAPHTYRAAGGATARALLVLTPGEEMERFFAEAGVLAAGGPAAAGGRLEIPAFVAVARKHGIAFLPPRQGAGGPGGPARAPGPGAPEPQPTQHARGGAARTV